jgi:predicted RNA-binding protein YlxR (DUF448 family)
MEDVNPLKFDVYSQDIIRMSKSYFYGFYFSLGITVPNKNKKSEMIRIVNEKYPNLCFVDYFNGGYILLKKSMLCENSNLENFKRNMNEWIEMCLKEQENMEKLIKEYMPKENYNIIQIYFL